MLVSVHLPKTAGSSFAKALESFFSDRLFKDYADLPTNTPALDRNRSALQASIDSVGLDSSEIECIHGHFLPLKYLLLSTEREVQFVTWMRHPVDRLLSHYHYWKARHNPRQFPSLHRKVIEEDWSLEQFCLSSEMQNLYTQFFWGFPLERFDFIGITEHYDNDLEYFSNKFIGSTLTVYKERTGPRNGSPYDIDYGFRREIENFHALDMVLYQRALEFRRRRTV